MLSWPAISGRMFQMNVGMPAASRSAAPREAQRGEERRERVVLGQARLYLLLVLEADDVVALVGDLQLTAVDAAVAS